MKADKSITELLEIRNRIANARAVFLEKEIPALKADHNFGSAKLKWIKALQMHHFKLASMKNEMAILSYQMELENKAHAKLVAPPH